MHFFVANFRTIGYILVLFCICIYIETLLTGPGCGGIDHFGGCWGYGDETRDHHGQYLLLKQQQQGFVFRQNIS